MGKLWKDLRDLGYERTERESPFDENGLLWTNAYELVCDETGIVIRKDESGRSTKNSSSEEEVYKYRNTEKVKLYGGYVSSYYWGDDGDGFTYERE